SSAARLAAQPGAAQRELRDFDEELYVERPRPLSLAAVQALPVPGRCALAGPDGDAELDLHPADGHTSDGMAVVVPWAPRPPPGRRTREQRRLHARNVAAL